MKDRLVKRLFALCFLLFVVGLVTPAAAGRSEAPPAKDQSSTEAGQQAAFSTPLTIPPLLEGTEKNGVLHFNLQVQAGEREFYPGAVSSTLGYNGNYLVPIEKTTVCPYKGKSKYWSIRVDGKEAPETAWAYPEPLQDAERVKDTICFYQEKLNVYVEDRPEEQPPSYFTK